MKTKRFVSKGLLILLLLVLQGTAFGQLALIRQGEESAGQPEPGEWHGWSVALGDFDGDGYADLATGAPLEKTASEVFSSGSVVINYGSPHGLTWEGAHTLSVIDGSLEPSENHQMGRALAAGDFNGDGFADLAVGLPASTVNGESAAGRVLVYYGGSEGLPGSASIIHQGMVGAAVENGDLFGEVLAAGHLGDDAFDDLIIGVPEENDGRGAVFVIRGGQQGLNLGSTEIVVGEDLGHANQPGDNFGAAVAAGNIVGFPGGELIVGAPNASLTPSAAGSGMVYIANTSNNGISHEAQRVTAIDFGRPLVPGAQFGSALCVGYFWGEGNTLSLAIGAPADTTGGRVYVGRGTPLGISWSVTLGQSSVTGGGEVDDGFGSALAAGDHDGDGYGDLAVGSPGEDFELAFNGDDTGVVQVFFGSDEGPADEGAATWWTIDLGDQFIEPSWLGHSLAAGRTSASARHSFVAGAPRRNEDRGQVFDIAPWRQVRRILSQSAVAADCEGNIVYALRPFEHLKIASTTKIMTVLLGCEATKRPMIDPLHVALDEDYQIEQWMYEGFPLTSGCSIYGYTPLPEIFPETYKFEDLLYACIFPSGNDAAMAIADAMTGEVNEWNGPQDSAPNFIALMNERAEEIGMNDTHFTNPAGTDGDDPYSTAYDMWLLAKTAMANPLFREVVGSTSYMLDKVVAVGEVGIYDTVPVNLSYGWLNSMKNRDSRIIGVKPGGTPGAKSTGVAAARFDAEGNKIAFATGFRWLDSTYGGDKLAALVQLGLAFCNTDVGTPSGLAPANPPSGSSPLARHTFDYGTQLPQILQTSTFETSDSNPVDPTLPSESVGIVDLQAFHSGEAETAGARWEYRAMWELPGGEQTGLRIGPVVGGRVRLHVVNESGTRVPDSLLRLSGSLHPAPESITLPAGRDFYPKAWDNFSIPLGNVELLVHNGGKETIFLSMDGWFDLQMRFPEGDGKFTARLEPLKASLRTGHLLTRGESRSGRGFQVELLVEDRQGGAKFMPEFRITDFDHSRPAGNTSEQLSLSFTPVDWDYAIDTFVEELVIEATEAIGGTWRAIDRLPPGRDPLYQWIGDAPFRGNGFLRVRSDPVVTRAPELGDE